MLACCFLSMAVTQRNLEAFLLEPALIAAMTVYFLIKLEDGIDFDY